VLERLDVADGIRERAADVADGRVPQVVGNGFLEAVSIPTVS
jgi:hypothetical protein